MKIAKSGLTITTFTLIVIMMMTCISFAKEGPVTLKFNGNIVQTEVAPVMESSRTLIPARAFFEAMGGTVSWDKSNEVVAINLGMDTVQLAIGSSNAQVNGRDKAMDVPARIIQNRTMIPVRFVSESIGCVVGWENETRTVIVSMAEKPKEPIKPVEPIKPEVPLAPETGITSISVVEKANYYSVEIKANGALGKYKSESYYNPERFAIDINDVAAPQGNGIIRADNDVFSSIRYSQFDPTTVRVVVDLNINVVGKITRSADSKSIFIEFIKPSEPTIKPDYNPTPGVLKLDPRMADKLILIDPGHGGSDPGACAKVNDKVVLKEKDLNLPIALKLREFLKSAGASVDMTRYTDTSLALKARPEMANKMKADIFVSIHNNSSTSSSPSGTEVIYFSKPSESAYNVKSKELANAIQSEMFAELGLNNRGARQVVDLVIVKYSTMPAVIIEGGFLSNEKDRAYMMTDEFIEGYAKAVATAIIKVMNNHAGD